MDGRTEPSPSDGADGVAEHGVSAAAQLRAARLDAMVEGLAGGMSYADVAREQNVSSKTVQRAMADTEVARRVSARRREMTSEVSGRLAQACADAVTALVAGLEEDRAVDRLRAAQLILSQATKFRTMEELEARVLELEARLDTLGERAEA